ncbi:DUF1350 family protein [Waterburya agarophytonicola K14]|uniref:DUF1350 family protein n=1 Tax=Waterburya agarophytonicola KI4 TaxID=2874699 RepID=A0A964BRI8_9CYAN|nr:DUF1350 family protein [Waterburya agarophytonicola]MCC0178294.1 DUF1350 family protein [Waterburya agarophytonicola KI4]
MNCQEISGNWVYLPRKKIIGIIHFLGGAFVATVPQISYRDILEQITREGYAVIATPFVNTFNHFTIAREVLNGFETVVERLKRTNMLTQGYLPIYGLGHSMGCKLHLLIGSLYEVERAGNILISFNNFPASQAVPFLEQFNISPVFGVEFAPSPLETEKIIVDNYNTRRNLLIKFDQDNLDQTNMLNHLLQNRFPDLTTVRKLVGNHLTPLNQTIQWKTGEFYTPLDAIGQWFNQGMSQNVNQLKRELLTWLNPMSAF